MSPNIFNKNHCRKTVEYFCMIFLHHVGNGPIYFENLDSISDHVKERDWTTPFFSCKIVTMLTSTEFS